MRHTTSASASRGAARAARSRVVRARTSAGTAAATPTARRRTTSRSARASLSVCDAYDAITPIAPTTRHARDRRAALEELCRCAGTQFDPEIVAAFSPPWSPSFRCRPLTQSLRRGCVRTSWSPRRPPRRRSQHAPRRPRQARRRRREARSCSSLSSFFGEPLVAPSQRPARSRRPLGRPSRRGSSSRLLLGPDAAEHAGARAHDADRLVAEHAGHELCRRPRRPVERILELSGNGAVVLRRRDQHGVGKRALTKSATSELGRRLAGSSSSESASNGGMSRSPSHTSSSIPSGAREGGPGGSTRVFSEPLPQASGDAEDFHP